MTDLLAERFLAVADTLNDGDWADVCRRSSRRGGRRTVIALSLAAALVSGAALAAGNGWLFTHHGNEFSASTGVAFTGGTWRVTVSVTPGGICTTLRRPRGRLAAAGCGVPIVGGPLPRGTKPGRWLYAGYLSYADLHGSISFGPAAARVARVVVTDGRGRRFTTDTVAAPKRSGVHARFWAVAVPHSRARTIAAYDRRGRLLQRTLLPRVS